MRSWHPTLVVTVLAICACGQPKSPSTEDACASDRDCESGLSCCHIPVDAPSMDVKSMNDRGFCVKQAVCANVVPPSQAPLP